MSSDLKKTAPFPFWNRRRMLTLVATIFGITTFLVAVGCSWYLAEREGAADVDKALRAVEADVLRRGTGTSKQISDVAAAMNAAQNLQPCTPEHVKRMSALVAGASYLQGMGYMQGDTLVCSTLNVGEIQLGPSNHLSGTARRRWINTELPKGSGTKLNIIETDGYVGIVVPELVLDVGDAANGMTLVQFDSKSPDLVLRSRGEYKSAWLRRYAEKEVAFEQDGYHIAMMPSVQGWSAVMAAMPLSEVADRVQHARLRLVPVGVLVGALLALLAYLYLQHRLALKTELRLALQRREFFLVYQPVMDLRNGHCVGAEALIRWNNRDGKLVSPVVFIPAAEEHGLIKEVTAQVMEMVAHGAAELIRDHPDVHIAINLSAEDLSSLQTEPLLMELLTKVGGGSSNIMIEATERGFMFPEKAKGVLISLRSQGFKVAIDDFGTGNSSLSYLSTYDLDYLKIDKSFVDELGVPGADPKILFHIISMAKSLGLEMIAEGVETQPQRDILRDAGVQYAQGWFYGKPMTMRELAAFIVKCNGPSLLASLPSVVVPLPQHEPPSAPGKAEPAAA